MKGDRFAVACIAVMVLYALFGFALGFILVADAPDRAYADEFAVEPKDRPVLGRLDQVREARETGVSAFWFDGKHYVIRDLPEDYVNYSAWYVPKAQVVLTR